MKRLFYIILLIGILICTITIESKGNLIATNNYITYNLGAKPNNLIMTDSYDIREKDLLIALFKGLISEDIEGNISPALAKEYKVSEDGLEYTFTLREGLKYSNGDIITSKDFVEFFKSFLEDKDNVYVSQLYCIFGVKDFVDGKGDFSNVAIRAKDENTLSIRLNYSCPYFIKILSEPVYSLRDYKNLEKPSYNDREVRYTGPFLIEKTDKNGELNLTKNLKYYDNDDVTEEKIRVTFIDNVEEALARFELNDKNNNIDIMIDSPINEYLRLSLEDKVKSFPSSTVYYLNFNIHSKSLIGDINFRAALNSIFSKEYYAQQISNGFAKPASLYVPRNNTDERTFNTYGNKEIGEEYLKKTKFTGQEQLILVYEKNNFNKRVAEDLAKNILEDLRIDILCQGYEKEELGEILEKGKYDIYLNKFTPISNDLSLYYELWNSKSKENRIKYNNAEFDKLIKSARHEAEEEKRNLLYKQCEMILKNELPSVPIYYVNTLICVKPNIYGVYATALGNIRLEHISKTEL
jgi:ABC-type oligopeptide transport system substrate-binding subunit